MLILRLSAILSLAAASTLWLSSPLMSSPAQAHPCPGELEHPCPDEFEHPCPDDKNEHPCPDEQ